MCSVRDLTVVLLAAVGLLIGSQELAAEEKAKIVVTGSSTIAPLMVDIARRYERLRGAIEIDVQTGGSSRGISDIRRGLADIGMVSRSLYAAEEDLVATPIAKDGVAMIVHADNPVERLSGDQIRGMYTGAITQWEDVGGEQGAITVVSKAEGRSTLEIFLDHMNLGVKDIRAHVIIGDNEQAIKLVAANRQAIGYVSIGTTEYHAKAKTPVKSIGIGRVPPSGENVSNGTYRVSRPLNLVSGPSSTEAVKQFLEYASGENVHDLVRDHFFSPISK